MTAETILHSSNVPLMRWFLAIYLMASNKGALLALRLLKQIGVSGITAHRMLRRRRYAMADRDSLYRLEGLVELEDAFVGGRRSGRKRGRGTEGKTPIQVVVENQGGLCGPDSPIRAAVPASQTSHPYRRIGSAAGSGRESGT